MKHQNHSRLSKNEVTKLMRFKLRTKNRFLKIINFSYTCRMLRLITATATATNRKPHSCLNDSTGFFCAAFFAGEYPNITPTETLTKKATSTEIKVTCV